MSQGYDYDYHESSKASHSTLNTDRLDTRVRGLDHVRAVYREGH